MCESGSRCVDDVAEQVHAPRVGPVRVVEQRDDGLRLRDALQNVDDRIEHQQSFGVGIGSGRFRRGRRPARQLGHEPSELAAVASDVLDDDVVAGAHHDAAQQLRPRRVRRRNVLVAPAEHHERAFVVGLARELRGQTRLPDPRFAGEENGRGAIYLRALPRVGESQPFVVARRERQLAGLAAQRRGQRRDGADRRGPRHFEHHDRFRQALQLDLADKHEGELGATAGETSNEIVAEDLASVGGVAQSRRGDDRGAVAVAAFPRHIARADTDAHFDAAVVARLAIGAVNRALDVVRRVHRVGSSSERGHDAVAQTLHHCPVVRGDRGPENLVVAPPDEIGLDIAESGPQLGAADDVGVQDRRGPRAVVDHRALSHFWGAPGTSSAPKCCRCSKLCSSRRRSPRTPATSSGSAPTWEQTCISSDRWASRSTMPRSSGAASTTTSWSIRSAGTRGRSAAPRSARTAVGSRRRPAQPTRRYDEVDYREGDVVVFGCESHGLPAELLAEFPLNDRLRIPMRPSNRSLNLGNAVSVVAYEAWRQHEYAGSASGTFEESLRTPPPTPRDTSR